MAQGENMTGRRAGRRVRVVLAISLALNLLVVGAIGGAVVMHGGGGHGVGPGGRHDARAGAMGGPLTRALTHQDRRALGRKIRQLREDAGGRGREARRAHLAALVAALRAVPFDPGAMQVQIEAHRGRMARDIALAQQVLIDHLSGMSDAERAEFAERVQVHGAGRHR